jgi:hypothetical protein
MPAGKGFVSLDVEGRLLLVPPVGRNVHVTCVTAPEPALRELGPAVTAVGTAGPPTLAERVLTVLPQARISPLGTMQRPPFDGPVDRRVPPRGELI